MLVPPGRPTGKSTLWQNVVLRAAIVGVVVKWFWLVSLITAAFCWGLPPLPAPIVLLEYGIRRWVFSHDD